jgi:hypothetical protein
MVSMPEVRLECPDEVEVDKLIGDLKSMNWLMFRE